jgi:Domain of unknown function (DUF4112)
VTNGDVARLGRYRAVANLLDQFFRVPGTSLRFGLDPLLGLIPGAGDLATAALGAYGLIVAAQLGAPASIQLRMLLNLLLDAGIGAIPIAGDLFDFAFKAHVRNLRLLEEWMGRPHATRRSSTLLLLGLLIAFVACVVGVIWLAFALLRALFHLFASAF